MTTGPNEENDCPLHSSLFNFELLQQLNEYTGSARSAWHFLLSQSPSLQAVLGASTALSFLGEVCENRDGHRVSLLVLLQSFEMGEVAVTKGQENKKL